jgi:Immunoglobulin domain
LSAAGIYAVGVTNAFGSKTSSNAVLSVGQPATIALQPTNQTARLGDAAVLEVVAAGTAPLAYQWSKAGTNLVTGTNSLLVITNAQLTDAGSYAARVSNAFGFANSSNALLSVGEPPAIVGQPTNQTVGLGKTTGLQVVVAGTAPLVYQWSFGLTNLLDATNSLLVITNAQLSDAGSYAVRVSNAFGFQNSSNAVLTMGLPPSILAQPTNLSIAVGGLAAFNIVAGGTPPLSWQWSFNGTNLLNATNSQLVITNVQLSDAGSYAVAVSNAFGSDDSSLATLFVYEIDHFAWDPIPSPRFVNVPFPVRIQASSATNGLLAGFSGTVKLTSTAGVSVDPSMSGDFFQGEWIGSVIVTQAITGAVLVADDGSGHLGEANPINVIGLPALSVEWSGVNLLISWPAEASAFAVETSIDLSSWSPLATSIDLLGGKYQIRVRISNANSFYRLRFVGPEGYPNGIITR